MKKLIVLILLTSVINAQAVLAEGINDECLINPKYLEQDCDYHLSIPTQDNALFTIKSATYNKQQALIPIVQAINEWSITFDVQLINADSSTFNLSLPSTDHSFDDLSVVRNFYKTYESGHSQWVGDIFSTKDKQPIGEVVINLINNSPFAIIDVEDQVFEIYTDELVGSRLAQINSALVSADDHDINNGSSDGHDKNNLSIGTNLRTTQTETLESFNVNSISVIDVLVVADDEYNYPGSPIWNRIDNEFMYAETILRDSGINGGTRGTQEGIPIMLNKVGIQFMDIPDAYENTTTTALSYLRSGNSAVSAELKHRWNASGADYVAVYVPFTPQGFDPCGRGNIPTNASEDSSFAYSVTINTLECNASQYLLIHELMHNFGARHLSTGDDNSRFYQPYASGFDITNSTIGNFSTVMGCTSDGLPSINATCGRKKQFSSASPLVTLGGKPLGDANADNSRFLSECDNNACRRNELATRNQRLFTSDIEPGITVTSHQSVDFFPVTTAFELTANVYDDNTGATVTWEVYKAQLSGLGVNPIPGVAPDIGTGVAPNYSYTTDFLDTSDYYIIRATATDSIGQTTMEEHTIVMQGTLSSIPTIDTATAGCGNRYCITLTGDNFGSDAEVVVRENASGSQPIETYSGNLIQNSGVNSNGDDFVIIAIVSVDQQAKFRNNGLCFTLLNGPFLSNETCFIRPVTNPQGPFMGSVVESYSTNQDIDYDAYIVKNNETVLKIWGNSWKKIARNYTVTPSTVLEFDFKSSLHEGEITGIGFLMNGSGAGLGQRTWQVHGTQLYGHQDFHDYLGNAIKSYRIPIGQKFTGQISHMVFLSDDDGQRAGQVNLFISPELKESEFDIYDDVAIRGYSDNVPGDAEPISGGQIQDHNFHQVGDEDWVIFNTGNGVSTLNSIQLGTASAHMWVYEVTGAFSQTSPDRWDITLSDLTLRDSDTSSGNNAVTVTNTSGIPKTYVVKVMSSGSVGSTAEYRLQGSTTPLPSDQYDDVSIRGYTDNVPGNAEPIMGGQPQIHNFHQAGDEDWVIFSMGNGTPTLHAIKQGDASVHIWAYEVTGPFTETSSGRWDITLSDLTMIDSDTSSGNNSVTFINTSGAYKTYVVKTKSSGPVGSNTQYTLTD